MADVDLIGTGAVEVVDGYRLSGPSLKEKWPCHAEPYNKIARYPSREGDQFTYSQTDGEYEIQYGALDKDGYIFWRPDGYQAPRRPYSKTFTMPAGTAYVVVSWQLSAKCVTPTLVKIGGVPR
ncbi:MAG: hypothetical protein ACI360_08625 [Atopobiaceae bacterium]